MKRRSGRRVLPGFEQLRGEEECLAHGLGVAYDELQAIR